MALSPTTLKSRLQERKAQFRKFCQHHKAQRLILTGVQQKLTAAEARHQRKNPTIQSWLESFGTLCFLEETGRYRKVSFDYLKPRMPYSIHVDYPARLEELYTDDRIDFRRSDMGNLLWMPRNLTQKRTTPHIHGTRYSFPTRFEWHERDVEVRPDKAAFLWLSAEYAVLITDFYDWTSQEACFLFPLLTEKQRKRVKKGNRGYCSLGAKPTLKRLLPWEDSLRKMAPTDEPLPKFSIKQLSLTYRQLIDEADVRLQEFPFDQQLVFLKRYWQLCEEEQSLFVTDLRAALPVENLVDFTQRWQ